MEDMRMPRQQFHNQDNRDSAEMYDYMESRITALKQRIFDLEMENATLRCRIEDSRNEVVECYAQGVGTYSRPMQTIAN
jgi:hypothetical protein